MAWGKWLGGKYFHALPFQRNQVTFQVKVPVPTAADVEIPKEMHFLFPSFFSTVLMAFFNALKENVFYNLDAETPPHLSSDTLCTLACLSFLGESSCVKRVLRDTAVHRWRYAQTVDPLGQNFAWDAGARIGLCGDWCIGHRVEDGFVSGLEMALALV